MSLEIADDLRRALEQLRERDGVPFTEQVRRALRMWFESRHITVDGGAVAKSRKAS